MAVGARLDHPELARLVERRADPRDRDCAAPLDVARDHLLGIDPVDVVGAEHADIVGAVVVD